MGFDTIPAIPADYPLYDWADWQLSRDALVSGAKTKNFQIAAWNAIVDRLADAITAAGQTWDSTYTTAEGAKLTTSDPKLYAEKCNSVRRNIDRQMHLDWPWAVHPASRGYVGREDFRGRQDVGKSCDLVYPEYILELARKLNLLLEIMRGTGPVCDMDCPFPSATGIAPGVRSGVGASVHTRPVSVTATGGNFRSAAGAPVKCDAPSSVATDAAPRCGTGAGVHVRAASTSACAPKLQSAEAVRLGHSSNRPALLSAAGRAKQAAAAETAIPAGSKVSAAVKRYDMRHASVGRLSASQYQAEAKGGQSVLMNAGLLSRPAACVALVHSRTLPGAADSAVFSLFSSEADKGRRLTTAGRRLCRSAHLTSARTVEGKPLPAALSASCTASEVTLCKGTLRNAAAEIAAGSSARMDVGVDRGEPLPPEPVKAGSAADARTTAGMSYPVTAAANGSTGVGMELALLPPIPVKTRMRADTDVAARLRKGVSAWIPVWENARSTAAGSLQAQPSAQVNLTGRFGTAASIAAVDTGWLTPVFTDGGLWIRQVHDEPIQRDNGDLEVR